jgi:hypothetical protein
LKGISQHRSWVSSRLRSIAVRSICHELRTISHGWMHRCIWDHQTALNTSQVTSASSLLRILQVCQPFGLIPSQPLLRLIVVTMHRFDGDLELSCWVRSSWSSLRHSLTCYSRSASGLSHPGLLYDVHKMLVMWMTVHSNLQCYLTFHCKQ